MSTTLQQPQANLFSTDKSYIDLRIDKKEFDIFTEDCTCIIDEVEFVKIIDLETNMSLPVVDTPQATANATPRKGISKFVSRMFNRMAVLPLTLPLCLVLVLGVGNVWGQTNNYFGTSGTISGSVWSTSVGGPYTSTLNTTGGAILNFNSTGSATGASISSTATTWNFGAAIAWTAGGTIGAASTNINFNISSGVLQDFGGSQAFSTSASAAFTKSGSGALGFTGGTFGGGFTLTSGTIVARSVNAMGGNASPGPLTLNGGTVAGSATRDFTGKYSNIVIGGNIQFGEMSTVISLANSTANLTFSNTMSLGSVNRTFTIGNGGNIAFGGVISNTGSNGLTFTANNNGTGRFDITGTNTFSGPVNINGNGTGVAEVRFKTDGSIGNAANTITIDGGRLAIVNNGTVTIANARNIAVGATSGTSISAPGTGTLTYNGVIADKPTTTGVLTKQGSGTLSLGGVSTYTGATSINNGTILLTTGNDRLPTGTVLSLGQASSTNLGTFNLNGLNQTIGGLNSTSGNNATASNNTITSAASATLTVSGSGTYGDGTNANSGIIAGAISLVKSGTGTLTLGDVNTYTGTTTINGGTLTLSGDGSIASSSAITVGSGGTFDVSGLTTALSLGASQSLKSSATGSNTTATITVASSKGITLSAGGLQFTAYGGGATAPLTVTGVSAGSLALASSPVTVTTTTALAAGTYKLIAIGGSVTAAVSGTIGTLTMGGSGLATNTTGALSIVSGELILTVTATPILTAATLASALSNVYGTPSTGVSFTASGSNLTANITATAQTGFAVSTTLGSGYGASVSVASGTTVYVQSTATKTVSTFDTATAVVLSEGGAASSVNITTSASGNSVTQKALTISSAAATSKTYDRTNSATITGSLSGIVNSDVVTLSGTGTFAQSNIGTAISVTSTSTLGGAGAGNYSLTQPTGLTANITAKALTVSGVSASNKTYDGTNTATVIGGSLVGIVSPDAVTLSQSGTFAQTTIGSTLSVTSTSTLGGADAGNYTLTQPTGLTANITAKALTVSGMTAADKTYDGTTTATLSGGSLVGVVSPDVVTLSQTGTFSQATVGSGLTVTSTSTLGGANAGNYSLTQPSGITASITKATPVINSSPSASDITLGQALSSSTLTGGSVTPSGGSFAFTSPSTVPGSTGSYSASITYTPADITNYNTVSSTTAVLVNAAVSPTINAVSLSSSLSSTYGTASTGISFTPSGSNLSENITVTAQSGFEVSTSLGSGYGASVSVASGSTVYVHFSASIAVGSYNNTVFAVLSSAGATNTDAITFASSNSVSQKILSISTASIASKTYNASATSGTVTAGTLSGFVGTETVTVSSAVGTYSDATVGTGKTATIVYTLANGTNGGLATNYSLANTSATGDITTKALSISAATIASKVYDVSATTGTITAGTLSGFVGSETVTVSAVTGIYSDANAGTAKTATISYTLANGSNGGLATNYTLSNTSSTGNITAKSLSISSASIASKTYDASATSGTVTQGTLSGFVGSETVTVSAAVGTYADGNAGTGKSATIVYTLADGANGGLATNYTLANTVGTGNITGKALTIVGATAQNKSYDGTTTATISGGTLSGIESGDVVTLSQSGTFATSNAGTGITVTSTSSIGGANSANYTLTQPNGLTANITTANLTITANDVSKNSGVALSGGAGSTTFTSTGLQNGQSIGSVTIAYGSAGSATGDGNTAGVYISQVTPSLASGGTFTASNYSINYVAGSITVIAVPITIAIQDFETSPATPTWTYSATGGATNSTTNKYNGAIAYRLGNSEILTMNNIDISNYTNVSLSVAFAASGPDSGEDLLMDISYDNGDSWTGTGSIKLVDGFNGTNLNINSTSSSGHITVSSNPWPTAIGSSETQISVRFSLGASLESGEYYYIDDIKLTGILNTSPTIFRTPSSLTGFSQNSSTPSSEQTYTVSGNNLTASVSIAPPTGFEISTATGGSFSATNPIVLTQTGGDLVGEPVTIYVRQSSSTLGVISGNVVHTSTGATDVNTAVSGTRTGTYYSKSSGNLEELGTWGINTDGSGSAPSNFSTDGIIYEIRNRATATIGANWTVSGAASKVLVGDGTNSTDFTIPSTFTLTGTIDVSNAGELTIENTTAPTIGTVADNGTVEYKNVAFTLSAATTYKNLKLSGSGTKTFPGGTTNITGNLTLENTSIDGGSVTFSTILLGGNLTYIGTVTPPADANSITLSTNGTAEGTQTITGAENTLRWFRITTTTANTILLSTSGGTSNLSLGNNSGGGLTLVDGSILNMNGNDLTLFNSSSTTTAFIFNNTASISTNSSSDFTIGRTGNGNLGTIRFTTGSSTIGSLTLNHTGSTNKTLNIANQLTIANSVTLTSGILNVAVSTLTINGSISRTSGNIDASNASTTVVFGGSTAQTIPASTFTGDIKNLTLNNSAGLSTNQDLSVVGTLALTSGKLTLGSNHLTLGLNATIGGTPSSSNMIIASGDGELRKRFSAANLNAFVFPVGTGSNYTPVELDFTSGTFEADAYMRVRVKNEKSSFLNSNVTTYLNRNWIVEPFGITSPNYSIQLYFNPAATTSGGDFFTSSSSMTIGDLKPVKYSSGTWYQPTDGPFTNATPQGTAGVVVTDHLVWNNLMSFSEFGGAGGSNQPLPVELLSFSAECANESITLKWQTASEFNSSHFEVEKSTDGLNWNTIGQLPAAGNSNELLSYSFQDVAKSINTIYYRLNQVDNDGLQKYYGPISPMCETSYPFIGRTIPNPSENEFWLHISTSEQQTMRYTLQDINGTKIMENTADLLPGSNMFPIRETIPSGMYFILLQTEKGQQQVIKHVRN